MTESSVVESALSQYLDEKCDLALILKKLDRIGRGVNRLDNQVNISAEAFGLFLQYWFAHTPEIAEEEKSLANADAKRRYRSFIDYLTQRLGAGSRFTDELVKDFVVGDDDELRQATMLAEAKPNKNIFAATFFLPLDQSGAYIFNSCYSHLSFS